MSDSSNIPRSIDCSTQDCQPTALSIASDTREISETPSSASSELFYTPAVFLSPVKSSSNKDYPPVWPLPFEQKLREQQNQQTASQLAAKPNEDKEKSSNTVEQETKKRARAGERRKTLKRLRLLLDEGKPTSASEESSHASSSASPQNSHHSATPPPMPLPMPTLVEGLSFSPTSPTSRISTLPTVENASSTSAVSTAAVGTPPVEFDLNQLLANLSGTSAVNGVAPTNSSALNDDPSSSTAVHSFNAFLPLGEIRLQPGDVYSSRDDLILATQKAFREDGFSVKILNQSSGAHSKSFTMGCSSIVFGEMKKSPCKAKLVLAPVDGKSWNGHVKINYVSRIHQHEGPAVPLRDALSVSDIFKEYSVNYRSRELTKMLARAEKQGLRTQQDPSSSPTTSAPLSTQPQPQLQLFIPALFQHTDHDPESSPNALLSSGAPPQTPEPSSNSTPPPSSQTGIATVLQNLQTFDPALANDIRTNGMSQRESTLVAAFLKHWTESKDAKEGGEV